MTIKEAAAHYGITPQGVYSRLKSINVSVEQIKNPETGELTLDGEVLLAKLFDKSTQQEQETKETLKQTCERLQSENNFLKTENETLLKMVSNLEAQVADLRADKDRYLGLAEGAQDAQRQLLQRFLPAEPEAPTRGVIGRLRGWFKR